MSEPTSRPEMCGHGNYWGHCCLWVAGGGEPRYKELERTLAAITAERDTEREKRRLIEAQHVRLCDEVYEQDGETLRQVALTAERDRLREVEAATVRMCVQAVDDAGGDNTQYHIDAIHRALAPERTVAGQEHYEDIEQLIFDKEAAAAPASPLLPGLERAAEICEATHRLYAHECAKFIRAEISRLKGEGSGS